MARSSVSLTDVARHAGVSPQTVSRVSNGGSGVLEPTRRRVLASMAALRYRPNSAARALKRGSFRSIAVVLSTLDSTGNTRLLRGVVESAVPAGYTVTVLTVDMQSRESLDGASLRLHEAAVDGVILVAEAESAGVLPLDQFSDDPLVIVASREREAFAVVDSDQAGGTRSAVRHLLGLGHETVHHVMGAETSHAARRRMEEWRAALDEEGREIPAVVRGDWSADSGFEAGMELASEPGVTAVFVANDEMALGLLRAFGQRGIRVPQDVSVVGFDDLSTAGNFPPPLTTVRQDFDEIGRRSVQRVLAQVGGEPWEPGLDLVPTELVVRESTGPAPGGAVTRPRRS